MAGLRRREVPNPKRALALGPGRRHLSPMPFPADPVAIEALLRARLTPMAELGRSPARSDYDLAPELRGPAQTLRPAAVLIPIVRRAGGWTMLFTLRAADLPTHAGQISFPGGRLQPEDADLLACALRETREEIGVGPEWVRPIGGIGAYETVTGFTVQPIVGLVQPGFRLDPDPREVAEVFEAPLSLVLDPARMQAREEAWRGVRRRYYALDFEGRLIWGATAGMLKALCDRLYE